MLERQRNFGPPDLKKLISALNIHHSPFTIRHSPLTIHHSPLTKTLCTFLFFLLFACHFNDLSAQTNLLLNGGFEDINICTEYNAECGVEAWFYLKDVKVEMLSNDEKVPSLGNNSFGLFYTWSGYTGFTPVIGTILPCRLQKDLRYIFRGMLKAKLNGRLILKPGVALGTKFYVPKRPFSAGMHPDSITELKPVPGTGYYQFEYSFIANGTEKYLTFGTYIEEDTVSGKRTFIGVQSISLTLDNFELVPSGRYEAACEDFTKNKELIYNYNFRHKEMDYSLFGTGELSINLDQVDSNYITQIKEPPPARLKPDTLKLGEVFFDFNKANLKPEALKILDAFFIKSGTSPSIDSIYVEGHTDSIGSDSRNLELSLQRCESIRHWLIQNNIIAATAMQVHPFGKSKPIASNSTSQGRAMNRRVEMIVFRKPGK